MKLTSNIVFFGTPPFSAKALDAIVQSDRKVSLVVTQPDRPSGRGLKFQAPAVKEHAKGLKLPLVQPEKMKDPKFYEMLKSTGASVFVVAAYGRILPKTILDLPKLTLNIHASLLPRYRGAAPIQRAILNGDQTTGISIMRLVEELDAGDYMLQKEVGIGINETSGELEERLADVGSKGLIEALDQLDRGEEHFQKQDSFKVTFAPPIKVLEAKIDWQKTCEVVHHQICAFEPHPGAFTNDGKIRMKIHKSQLGKGIKSLEPPGSLHILQGRLWIACSDGWLEILEVQKEGKSRQSAKVFLSGYRASLPHQWNS